MIKYVFISTVIAVFATGAFAAERGQGMGAGGQRQYRNLDTNGDGYISSQEIQAYKQRIDSIAQNLNKADLNKDGKVDISEFSAFEEKQAQEPEQK
jgi:hypothetical protein